MVLIIISRHREVDNAGTNSFDFKKGFKSTCNPGTGAAGIKEAQGYL